MTGCCPKGYRAGSGLRHSHANTQAMQMHASTTAQRDASVNTRMTLLSAIIRVALHLDRRLTQPPLVQLRSMGPNRRWCQSHRNSAGELRAAAHAAIRMNTVVGSPGTTYLQRPESGTSLQKPSAASARVAAAPWASGCQEDRRRAKPLTARACPNFRV